ncbi:MAG: hypothetical protein ACHQYP_02600 [Nitrospiria bacterium]
MKTAIFSTLAGFAIYYCDWLEFFFPGFSGYCLWSNVTNSLFFIILMILSGFIGYSGFKEPLLYFFLFMVPSWIVRLIMITESGSNIYPIVIGSDFIFQVMIPGFVLDIVARFRRRRILKSNRLKMKI